MSHLAGGEDADVRVAAAGQPELGVAAQVCVERGQHRRGLHHHGADVRNRGHLGVDR